MTTNILSDQPAVIVEAGPTRFHWGPVIAGALVAAATAFFLVALGTGFGLALSPHTGAKTFLTLGAIYFFAAQAFGFAAGGHVTGRLIGPARESLREEEFRAGLPDLVMWAVAVVAGLVMLALAAMTNTGTMPAPAEAMASGDYWTDTLFRTDRSDVSAADLETDKASASRLLAQDMVAPKAENAQELARLVVLDTELSHNAALGRVVFVESQMRQEAEAARKAAAYASLWTAFALLFGAVIAVAAAISARWEDDKLSFGFARRY